MNRLTQVSIVHLILGMCPLAVSLVPAEIRYVPALWLIASVVIAQLMLLSFWVGFGTGRTRGRWLKASCAVAYLATWSAVGQSLSKHYQGPPLAANLLVGFISGLLVVSIFAGVFLAIRRWKAELRHFADPAVVPVANRFQYSLLHLLLVTSVFAVVLGLARAMRGGSPSEQPGPVLLGNLLMFVLFLTNLLMSSWATLSSGGVGPRLLVVFLTASILGIATSFGSSMDTIDWWLSASMMGMTMVPMAIVTVSLLVVRSCGYRLVAIRHPAAPSDAS